jgi:hypothetical protein
MIADQRDCTLGSFTQSGGFINGVGNGLTKITAATATFSNAVINKTPIVASYLVLSGPITVNSGNITVTNVGLISETTSLTLGFDSHLITQTAARITQSASLVLLSAGTQTKPPSFINNGRWNSSRDLTINIRTTGNGSLIFSSGSTLSVTGVTFNMNTVNLANAVLRSIGSNFTADVLESTTGSVMSQSLIFTVTGHITLGSFTHVSGNTRIFRGTINNLNVTAGTFNVTGTGATNLGNLRFFGGTITSTGPAKNVNANAVYLLGQDLKTISRIMLTSGVIIFQCQVECELVAQSATLTTG